MKISIIGCGHVGLVVAVCLARLGNEITVIETDEEKIRMINNKTSPIFEAELDEILSQVNIEVTSNYTLLKGSEIIIICVHTPSSEDGSISLEHITNATKQIADVMDEETAYHVVSVKSTVVPGTVEETIIPILESSGKKAGIDFGICMVPEFIREGHGVFDFMNPARIVVGQFDQKSGDVLHDLYRDFKAPILRVDLKTAEMIK